ncbi:hypothetical protein PISMIDRAFT_687960 [Pisolithus microcarpus 441]|uniref:Uncharacterized protein n=1 Tax=Pisolithus microcarpus 441 TaxID=765257 RepID=A0A0C9YWE2_9AGAM|nr:hypothetical protein PISMIDRAFT_687960 [Pisolithus microcarpus 441]
MPMQDDARAVPRAFAAAVDYRVRSCTFAKQWRRPRLRANFRIRRIQYICSENSIICQIGVVGSILRSSLWKQLTAARIWMWRIWLSIVLRLSCRSNNLLQLARVALLCQTATTWHC